MSNLTALCIRIVFNRRLVCGTLTFYVLISFWMYLIFIITSDLLIGTDRDLLADLSFMIANTSNTGNDLRIIILSLNIRDPMKFYKTKTYFSKDINSRYNIISRNKLLYAHKYGYKYMEITDKSNAFLNYFKTYYDNKKLLNTSMYREQWNKPLLIKSVLNNPPNDYKHFDYLLWMDIDAAFINCSINISQHIIQKYPHKDIIASGSKDSLINNGVFLLKNTNWTRQFIDKWIFTKMSGNFNQFFENSTRGMCRNCGDQSVFEILMVGFDPYKDDYDQLKRLRMKYLKGLKGYSWKEVNHSMKILPKNISNHVQILPQNMINSFNDTQDDVFIWHCAGAYKTISENCKIFDERIQKVSTC